MLRQPKYEPGDDNHLIINYGEMSLPNIVRELVDCDCSEVDPELIEEAIGRLNELPVAMCALKAVIRSLESNNTKQALERITVVSNKLENVLKPDGKE